MNPGQKAECDSKNSFLLPFAWQPLTPRGVAAFTETGAGRIFLVELFFALLCAAGVIWFLHDNWFPTVREAIHNLPQRGKIREGKLNWFEESPKVLASSRFISLTVDLGHTDKEGREAQVCAEFGRNDLRLISLLGFWRIDYSKHHVISFNRPELEPWWGAWEPMMYAGVAIVTIACLFVCWCALATVYSAAALLVAFFANRKLSWLESWRLSSAALMPGALFLIIAIIFYGLGWIDLIRLGFAFAFHFVIGWVYLLVSPFFLPKHPQSAEQQKNPFGFKDETRTPKI
jgi:hypothetical protein